MIDSLADWLVDQSLGESPLEEIFEGTCKRLYAAGIPIARSHVTFSVLHPLYKAQALNWQRDRGLVSKTFADSMNDNWVRVGEYELRGVNSPIPVYAPPVLG